MGGDGTAEDEEVFGYQVSIHTPVWGVTEETGIARRDKQVSIHTPVWGVTGKS